MVVLVVSGLRSRLASLIAYTRRWKRRKAREFTGLTTRENPGAWSTAIAVSVVVVQVRWALLSRRTILTLFMSRIRPLGNLATQGRRLLASEARRAVTTTSAFGSAVSARKLLRSPAIRARSLR